MIYLLSFFLAALPNDTTDLKITNEIRMRIKEAYPDKIVNQVTFSAVGGTVTLKGNVQTARDKEVYERIARSTPGVKNVDNEIIILGKKQ
jgi:osmotically-inducible protein OsmY